MSRCRIDRGAQLLLPILCCTFTAPLVAAQPYNVALVSHGGAYWPVQVVGRYAYVGAGGGSQPLFAVVDVSTPTSPILVGRAGLPDWAIGIHVNEGLAYVGDGVAGLQIVDVTNPTSPTVRGSYPTQWLTNSVFVSGGLAFVADGKAGLQIVNVTNPSSPTLRCRYKTPDYAADVFVSGGLAYVADHSSLQILDITDPSSPTLRGSYQDPSGGRIWNVFVSSGVAYVTATSGDYWTGYYATFLSLDVANPAAPRLLGSYGTAGVGAGLYVSGGMAYVLMGDGLSVLDVTLRSVPRLGGFYPVDLLSEGDGQVSMSSGLLYVTGFYADLYILRFTSPPSRAVRWSLYR